MWWDDQLGGGPAAPSGDLCARPAAALVLPARRQNSDGPRSRRGTAVGSSADPWQWWWDHARDSAKAFLAGHVPPAIAIFGPVLEDGESGLLEADVTLCFLYGGDGQYARSDYLVVARPAMVAAALAVNAAISHRRRRAAQRDAEPSWRDQHTAHVWSTTRRLFWDGRSGLQSLWFGDISGFYPDLDRWTLTLSAADGKPAVRLTGPAVPLLTLWTATAVMGQRWAHDPRLAALLR